MRNRSLYIYLPLALFFIAAGIIDVYDGYVPKAVSSLSLAIAFILLLTDLYFKKAIIAWLAYGFIIVALAGFAYRIMQYYQLS